MSMHIPICQWSYLWVISASQRSIYSELFLFISQWHPEHNAHSVSFSAMARFIDTNRGGKTIHFEGYIYTKIYNGWCKLLASNSGDAKTARLDTSKSHFKGKQCGCTKGEQPPTEPSSDNHSTSYCTNEEKAQRWEHLHLQWPIGGT